MRHDQKPDKSLMVCTNCKKNNCKQCIDLLLKPPHVCRCERKDHKVIVYGR